VIRSRLTVILAASGNEGTIFRVGAFVGGAIFADYARIGTLVSLR